MFYTTIDYFLLIFFDFNLSLLEDLVLCDCLLSIFGLLNSLIIFIIALFSGFMEALLGLSLFPLMRELGQVSENKFFINEYYDKFIDYLNIENNTKIFEEGKQLFNSNCAHCHGKKGDGNGPMVKSGAYAGVPNYSNLTNLGDGQIFYSIYYGKGMMGAHNSLLSKKEIWTLVHYVRKFQYPDYGNFDSNEVSNIEQ